MDDSSRLVRKKSGKAPSITNDLPTVKIRPSLQGKKHNIVVHYGPCMEQMILPSSRRSRPLEKKAPW